MQLYNKQSSDGLAMPNGEVSVPTIEGLPLIGAQAEREARDEIKNYDSLPDVVSHGIHAKIEEIKSENPDITDDDKILEKYYDSAGAEAMTAEVKNRAMELARKRYPIGSDELVEKYGQKAADMFKKEMETKTAERKTEQDKGLQAMIDAYDAPDAQLPPELMPKEPETPEPEDETAKPFKSLGIHVETPQGHSGYSHLDGTEITP
ncbi:MAG TPA: hypothetical protein VMR16_02560 [Candidatus Saccharimonadales bacterium]|nr:hypothetical protein [Candidatus Saccharimonadales bacterium]